MASVFDIYDQRPTSKSKATEYFTWSLKKIKQENWDANVSFYWHKNAVDYCKKRQIDIFGSEEQEQENDANAGKTKGVPPQDPYLKKRSNQPDY